MKLKVITKLLIGSSLAMVAIAPTLTLSSCASISQWILPINIGGIGDKSPWSAIIKADQLNKSDSKGYTYTTNNKYTSPKASFASYLPNSFISYTDRSASTTNYEYAQIYNDKDWNKNDNPSYFDPQWVNNSNTNLQKMTESYDIVSGSNKKTVTTFTSIQNANLYNALSFNSLTSGINIYVSGLLRLMTEDGVMNTKSGEDWYNALFGNINNKLVGGLDHGGEGTNNLRNKQFYEFLFDTLDNLSEGSVPAKFGESGANYKFASYIYGPGPYISYENEVPSGNATPSDSQKLKEFVGRDKDDNNKQYSFTEDQIPTTILTNTDDPYLSADFVLNGVSNELQNTSSARGAYTAFVSNTTDANLGNNKFYPSIITTQIPFVVNPDDFTFSYYNPLVKHTFQQNDYLLSDITPVQKQIANTNAWSNFSKHVDTSSNFKDKDKWAESLSWKFNTNQYTSDQSNASNPFYPEFATANDFFGTDKLDDNIAYYIDPTIVNILSGKDLTSSFIQPNSYIAFANYAFASFPIGDDPNNVTYESMPIFGGIAQNSSGEPAVFPCSLLFKASDLNDGIPTTPTSLDYSLFTDQLMPEANALYNYKVSGTNNTPYHKDTFKNNKRNRMYYLDLNKLYTKQHNVCNLFGSNINLNTKPSEYYQNNKDAFQTIWDLFSHWTYSSDTWSIGSTVSSSIFIPVKNAS